MSVAAGLFAAVAAALHVFIFVMESVLWSQPKVWKRFSVANQAEADLLKPMAFNQGFYNLFLALGIVVGLIIGALARLFMPGKQDIGIIMTIVLGVLGSLIGSWLTYQFGYSNANGGWEVIPFIVGIVVAIVLIAAYLAIRGRTAVRH